MFGFRRKIVVGIGIALMAFNFAKAQEGTLKRTLKIRNVDESLSVLNKHIDGAKVENKKEVDISKPVREIVDKITDRAVEYVKNKDYRKLKIALDSLMALCDRMGKEGEHEFRKAMDKVFWKFWRDIRGNIPENLEEAEKSYASALETSETYKNDKWKKRFENKMGPKLTKARGSVAALSSNQ